MSTQYAFGTGVIYGRNTTPGSTPVRLGALQGVTIDLSFSTKELYGQFQFPLALGRGTGKITGKADYAQFNAQAWNDLFFGAGSVLTGATQREAVAEAQTVTANTVNVTHNGANFIQDSGVVLASDGSIFTRVANTPVGQQYTVNESSGAYTFNATFNAAAVQVSYLWLDTTSGKKIQVTNQLLGNAPTFSSVFTESYQGNQMTIVLNQCMSDKLSIATKLEDFVIPSFGWSCFADASGNIMSISLEQ